MNAVGSIFSQALWLWPPPSGATKDCTSVALASGLALAAAITCAVSEAGSTWSCALAVISRLTAGVRVWPTARAGCWRGRAAGSSVSSCESGA